MSSERDYVGTEIAIVGMAGRFPGSPSVRAFWENLRDGVECIARFDKEQLKAEGLAADLVDDPDFVPANGILEDIDLWDAKFFGFSPRDAAIMDPQHRLFLECAWEALEHAGYDPSRFPGNVGVYGGSGMPLYIMYNLMSNPSLVESLGFFHLRHTGNDKDFLTTRVSYEFNLRGPSVNVQTACSTSLVAVHMAAQSLLNGESDMALAGGVTLDVQRQKGYLYTPGEVLSPDGHCRAWDEGAAGTVFGSGVGLVVLKRLEDALADGDTVHAVIRGSAINNDGAQKVGYMAPSVDGQAAAVAEAIALAGVHPETISYIETHGTGTPVGDPIELAALKQVFGTETTKEGFCAIGSVKTNIGHLDTAAGVAGLIKTVEALKHRQLPPSLHFTRPNPKLGIEGSPFFVNDTLRPWQAPAGAPRRAAVNSLGVGGTNAHVIVEEAPPVPAPAAARGQQLLLLSAKSPAALEKATRNLAAFLKETPEADLADVAYTLQVGRRAFEHRRALVARDAAHAVEVLEAGDPKGASTFEKPWEKGAAVFMFAGGGAQYPNMGRGLYEQEPVYRAAVDECLTLLRIYEQIDLRPYLFAAPEAEAAAAEALQQPSLALPALLTTQYALAKQWMAWGVEPEAMIGHSMGEYPAALLAGVMSLKDALSLVTLRGRLFEKLAEGSMLSVPLSAEEVEPLLGDDLSIAAVNAPGLCVASGPTAAIERLEAKLVEMDAEGRRIKINVAAHSQMVEPILDAFRTFVRTIRLQAPQRPFVSNVTGTWITAEEATDPEYWVRHIRQTVRFAEGVETLLAEPSRVMLEVGPGRILASLTSIHPARPKEQMVLTSLRHPKEDVPDLAFLLGTLGRLWTAGVEIDWKAFHGDGGRRRVPLPTYPFERQRYWVEPGHTLQGGDGAVRTIEGEPVPEARLAPTKQAKLDDWFYAPVWKPAPAPAASPAKGAQHWLVFAADLDGLDAALVEDLRRRGDRVTVVREGDRFTQQGDAFTLRTAEAEDYTRLVRALAAADAFPNRILHCWSMVAQASYPAGYEAAVDRSFYSLFYLARALGQEDVGTPLVLDVVSSGMQFVLDGEAVMHPEAALVLGPCKVIPQEFPNVRARSIDVSVADLASRNGRHPLPALVAELDGEVADEVLALRGGKRYVQTYERTRVAAAPQPPARLREGGVYLITGGTGGIGLTLARHLAGAVHARLVLVGRTPLPPRDAWDSVLADPEASPGVVRRIQDIRAIEAYGAEVLPVAADVADGAQVQAAVQAAKARFGAVHGVIHAAGVLDDGLILTKEGAAAAAVLAPKVQGTRVLEAALAGEPLDFFVVFSSTSAILGSAGQVDYAAANAFLNAFAASKAGPDGPHTVAIDWGMWREVGMAAEAAGQTGGGRAEPEPKRTTALDHPYFRRHFAVQEEQVLVAELSVDRHWFLGEHRLATGESVVPGTMYLEMARAAYAQVAGDGGVALRKVYFLAPIQIGPDETRAVRVKLKPRADGYDFSIVSRVPDAEGEGAWVEHVGGQLAAVEGAPAGAYDLAGAEARCDGAAATYTPESQPVQPALRFGGRWKNLRAVRQGAREAVATLALEDGYAADLAAFPLHPALLDIATSAGMPLIDGFDRAEDFYVPLSYRAVRVVAPLTPTLRSHVRYRADKTTNREVAVFDVTLTDPAGRVLVDIEGYVMRRVRDAAVMTQQGNRAAVTRTREGQAANEGLAARLVHAIKPAEGIEAFQRVLEGAVRPQVVVSSVDLHALIQETRAPRTAETPAAGDGADYVGPRDEVEQALVELWQTMLGANPVGIRDDFFALGGHSLIAVRLFARIQKRFGVELSLATLFQAPTIEQCAEIIREELGIAFTPQVVEAPGGDGAVKEPSVAVSAATAPGPRANTWTPLVPIQKRGTQLPFFCVHGAGGNVLNFRDLSVHLGADQPFYGLQARGVDGKQPPHERIEDMAAEYVAAVRTVQPQGPYRLGGYSGGGVIALEMAHQLVAAGEEVALVAFLDTFCPKLPAPPAYTFREKARQHLSFLRDEGAGYVQNWFKRRFQFESWRFRSIALKHYLRTNRPLPYDIREVYLTQAFHDAAGRYEPRRYEGEVVLFTAGEKSPELTHVPMDLGWGPYIAQGLRIHGLTGNHDNLVLEPYVQDLAAALKAELEEARAVTA